MTGPESKRVREEAKNEVADALERAASVRDRGARIAEGWRQSRSDNNFRQMLRNLGSGTESNA